MVLLSCSGTGGGIYANLANQGAGHNCDRAFPTIQWEPKTAFTYGRTRAERSRASVQIIKWQLTRPSFKQTPFAPATTLSPSNNPVLQQPPYPPATTLSSSNNPILQQQPCPYNYPLLFVIP